MNAKKPAGEESPPLRPTAGVRDLPRKFMAASCFSHEECRGNYLRTIAAQSDQPIHW